MHTPLQAHCPLEVEEFVGLASALLVNVGTLSEDWVVGMRLAAGRAGALGRPWVLDPVGCGATRYRTQVGVCGLCVACVWGVWRAPAVVAAGAAVRAPMVFD